MHTETFSVAISYPGLAKFGIAPGLGACNTPGEIEKFEIPGSLVNTGASGIYLTPHFTRTWAFDHMFDHNDRIRKSNIRV